MSRFEIVFFYRRTESIYSKIEFLGGYNTDGSKWKMPIDVMVDAIKTNKYSFYILINLHELNVIPCKNDGSNGLCIDFPVVGLISINDVTIKNSSE